MAKTETLISCAVTAKLICVFVFAYANRWFPHAKAHFDCIRPFYCYVRYFTNLFSVCSCKEVVNAFKQMDCDGSGKLDAEEAREGLKALKTATGRPLDPKEIDFFIQTASGEDGQMDLGAFTNLMYRLKLYDAPPPPKNVKIVTRDVTK